MSYFIKYNKKAKKDKVNTAMIMQDYKISLSFVFLMFAMHPLLASSQSVVQPTYINLSPTINNQTQNLAKNCSDFPSFKDYIIQFKKNYTINGTEYLRRQETYKKRVEQLKVKCMDPSLDYEVCVNKFSDLTDQERARRKPLLSADQASKKVQSSKIIKIKQSAGAPSSLDWRTRNVITSIKDQGSCGSCWTFATNAYGQSRMILKNLSDINIDLSEQYLLSCTPECTCDGGYLQYVFQKAATGVPLESSYSYSPYSLVSPFICWAGSKKYFGYIPQKHYDLSDSQLISLLQIGPVAISISATNWQDYKSGIFRCNSVDKVNHAVLLIGYTNDNWLVKNQWGEDWGEKGYIRVTRNRLNNCKIGASAFTMWQKTMVGAMVLVIVLILG